MSEALNEDDEGPLPATNKAVEAHVRDALTKLNLIESTGDTEADADLLNAEQALRRVLAKIKD